MGSDPSFETMTRRIWGPRASASSGRAAQRRLRSVCASRRGARAESAHHRQELRAQWVLEHLERIGAASSLPSRGSWPNRMRQGQNDDKHHLVQKRPRTGTSHGALEPDAEPDAAGSGTKRSWCHIDHRGGDGDCCCCYYCLSASSIFVPSYHSDGEISTARTRAWNFVGAIKG